MYYVYILECADGSLYTGIARDVEERLATHRAGNGAKYTRSRLPLKLVYVEKKRNKSFALKREYEIKCMPRQKKLALTLRQRT